MKDEGIAMYAGDKRALQYHIDNLKSLQAAIDLLPADRRRTAVQAGGALGVFPAYLAGRFNWVYTFEPDPVNFDYLCRNAPHGNIVKMQCALGCKHGMVSTNRNRRDGSTMPFNAGCTWISQGGAIPMVKLEDIIHDDAPVDLLFLDVEGYELMALHGADRIVLRQRPVIGIEVNKQMELESISMRDIFEWMAVRNYAMVAKIGSDQIWMYDQNTD